MCGGFFGRNEEEERKGEGKKKVVTEPGVVVFLLL